MPKARWLCLSLCALTAWWPVKQCLAETPAKGTISGRVVNEAGETLRRATVVIEEINEADGSSETVGDRTTDDKGEFSFSTLTPARYRLKTEKSGYVAGRFPRTKALVRLNSGDIINDITLRMVPVSVVSGYVLDGNGDPLAKAVIRLLQYKYRPGCRRRLTVAREAISDERGEYRIGDLNPGRYYVVASYHSRISDVVCPPVYYPEVASFDDATPIRLLPNDEASIKFVLLPGKPVHVRGSVVGWAGNVRVFLIPRGGVPYARLLGVNTSDGSFQFKGVLPGDYMVLATSQSTDEMLEGRTPITVGDHEVTGVSVRVEPLMAPRLLVSVLSWVGPPFISPQDIVISLHRKIASNEDSLIVAEDDLVADARQIRARAGKIIDLPYPGPFVVSAENLPDDAYIGSAHFQDQHQGARIQGTERLIVQLFSGASLKGVVLDSNDNPLPGAVVAAVPQQAPDAAVDLSRTTTTDQYGQFVLHCLAKTVYDVYAWEDAPDGAYYDPDFLADYVGARQGINISSGSYQVKLHAAATAAATDEE